MDNAPADESGMVYLVGAGPGEPGLITLRGVECLRRADIVLFDYLVNPVLLDHAPPAAERVPLRSHGKQRWPQERINERMIAAARQGQRVVRLKGGDPAVFARIAEETEALVAAGIPFEIVPGITAALAAGSCAGIPITHRDLSSAVALVTGQENQAKEGSSLDWEALARFPGTLVFYMAVTTAPQWTAALMDAGKPPATPAAIIRRCSFADQETIRCTLGDVAGRLSPRSKVPPPAIVIVGGVAGVDESLCWFERRPLFGKSVLVTRPRHQAADLGGPLAELGADVLYQPAIEIGDPPDWSPVDAALARLDEFDWLVFSSSNGVRFLLDRLSFTGRDLRALGGLRLAAIGPGTAEELARYRLAADLIPDQFRAESLAAALAEGAPGRRFLLARASRGREVLAGELTAAGGTVEQIVVYSSRDAAAMEPPAAERLASGSIDYVTVTSSAIARALHGHFGGLLRSPRLVSISPITSAVLRELGLPPAAEAETYDMPGVVKAILEHARQTAAATD